MGLLYVLLIPDRVGREVEGMPGRLPKGCRICRRVLQDIQQWSVFELDWGWMRTEYG